MWDPALTEKSMLGEESARLELKCLENDIAGGIDLLGISMLGFGCEATFTGLEGHTYYVQNNDCDGDALEWGSAVRRRRY